jgi:hypothetical protein
MPVVDFARLLFSIIPTPMGKNDEVFSRVIVSLNVPWDKSKAEPLGCLSVRQGCEHPVLKLASQETPPAGTTPTTTSKEPSQDVVAQLIAKHNDAMDDLRVQIIEQVFRIEELEHQVKILEAERAAQKNTINRLVQLLDSLNLGATAWELLNVAEPEGAPKQA